MKTLCDQCFPPAWAEVEILTIPSFWPCACCGKHEKDGLRCNVFRDDPRFRGLLRPTREQVIALARNAGVNGDPAKDVDDDTDTWYGNQYLPSGALEELVTLAMREGRAQALEIAMAIYKEADKVAHPDAKAWTDECVQRIRGFSPKFKDDECNEKQNEM